MVKITLISGDVSASHRQESASTKLHNKSYNLHKWSGGAYMESVQGERTGID